jgi:hypothetical protein
VSETCRAEALELLRIAATLEGARSALDARLESIRTELEALLGAPELETLEVEVCLDRAGEGIREAWLGAVRAERLVRDPSEHETRLAAVRPPSVGWDDDHLVFASGAAALSALLQAYVRSVRPFEETPLRLGLFGGSRDTLLVLDVLAGSALQWFSATSQHELCAGIAAGAVDALLLEALSYAGGLVALDLDAVAAAWRARRSERTAVVVLDGTSLGPAVSPTRWLEDLGPRPPALAVLVDTCSSLEQNGLAVAEIGQLSLYTPDGGSPAASEIGAYLRGLRDAFGTVPAAEQLSALGAPFVLEPGSGHAERVYRRNARAAAALAGAPGLAAVSHPSLAAGAGDLPAPFMLLVLEDESLPRQRAFLAELEREAQGRGVPLTVEPTYGARGHRAGLVHNAAGGPGLLTLAMGGRGGPSESAVLELVREVARRLAPTRSARPGRYLEQTRSSRAAWRQERLRVAGARGGRDGSTRCAVYTTYGSIPLKALEGFARIYVDVASEPPWNATLDPAAVLSKLEAHLYQPDSWVGLLHGERGGVAGFCWGATVVAETLLPRLMASWPDLTRRREALDAIVRGLRARRVVYVDEIGVAPSDRGPLRSLGAFVHLANVPLREALERRLGIFCWTLEQTATFKILNGAYQFALAGSIGQVRFLWASPAHARDVATVATAVDFRTFCAFFRSAARRARHVEVR